MINELKKIIHPKATVPVNKAANNDSSSIVLEEDGEYSNIHELIIQGVPDETLAFTLDVSQKRCDIEERIKFARISHYLDSSNKNGLLKSCDLVIVSKICDKFHVVLLEQKSKDPNIDEANRQLENSKIFLNYLIELLRSIYSLQIRSSDIVFKKNMATTRVVKFTVNISSSANQRELERRGYLDSLGMKEITIRPGRGRKGTVNYRALVR